MVTVARMSHWEAPEKMGAQGVGREVQESMMVAVEWPQSRSNAMRAMHEMRAIDGQRTVLPESPSKPVVSKLMVRRDFHPPLLAPREKIMVC
jgi:hypothetical protein